MPMKTFKKGILWRSVKKNATYKPKFNRVTRSFASKVRRVVAAEKKYLDTVLSGDTSGQTGSITHLTSIPLGDTNVTRDGNKVRLASILMRFYQQPDTDNPFGDSYRFILFQDKQQIADTAPSVSDVLEVATSTISPLNGNSGNRFRIIKDWEGTIKGHYGNSATSGGVHPVQWKYFKKLNIPLQYNGANGSDIQKNGLYLLCLHLQGTSGLETNTTVRCRVRFYDS